MIGRGMDIEHAPSLREFRPDYRWDDVACMPYKDDGAAPFKAISRQVLFHEAALGCELRYFEMDAGGYSTLERHEHMHAVMILRGHGQCLLGDAVREVKPFDLVTIPGWTWREFAPHAASPWGSCAWSTRCATSHNFRPRNNARHSRPTRNSRLPGGNPMIDPMRGNNGPRYRHLAEDGAPYKAITIDKLTPIIGAEIGGVDLSRPLGNRTLDEIHRALAENCVIFFRDQHLTEEQHLDFGRKFGNCISIPPRRPPRSPGVDDHPRRQEQPARQR